MRNSLKRYVWAELSDFWFVVVVAVFLWDYEKSADLHFLPLYGRMLSSKCTTPHAFKSMSPSNASKYAALSNGLYKPFVCVCFSITNSVLFESAPWSLFFRTHATTTTASNTIFIKNSSFSLRWICMSVAFFSFLTATAFSVSSVLFFYAFVLVFGVSTVFKMLDLIDLSKYCFELAYFDCQMRSGNAL